MSDLIASLKWKLKSISLWQDTTQVFRITVGLVILGAQTVCQFFQKYNIILIISIITKLIITNIIISFFKILWFSFFLVKFIILMVFAPFSLFIKILDYNSRQFINFWLLLLFDTKLEKIITFDNGLIHFQILSEWIRFFNVMCITGLVLGLFTYYTIIRTIYWMTKLEKKKQRINKFSASTKDTSQNPGTLSVETKLLEKSTSILKNYLPHHEQLKNKSMNVASPLEQSSPLDPNQDKGTSESYFDINSITSDTTTETLAFDRILPEESEEDDIENYESLAQLSGKTTPLSSPMVFSSSTKLQASTPFKAKLPIATAFRPIFTNSETSTLNAANNSAALDVESQSSTMKSSSNPSTVTSNIFTINKLQPQTPITTIEEDEEEDGVRKFEKY